MPTWDQAAGQQLTHINQFANLGRYFTNSARQFARSALILRLFETYKQPVNSGSQSNLEPRIQ